MQELDISHTILTKSDQLNADDLIGNEMIITVTGVKLGGGDDQPLTINYENDNGHPYKPCKSMRKVLAGLWGKDANKWLGQSMQLFNDPSVRWSGKEVGGIRISGLSGIDKAKNISMNESKHKKVTYTIERIDVTPAQRPVWPNDKFNDQFDRMKASIESGKSDAAKIITHLQKTADVTDEQIKRLSEIKLITEQSDDEFFNE